PGGEAGIRVVRAERRPRRLGDARREASLGSWYRDAALHSGWDDAEARRLEGLDLLVYASRLIGAETSLVVWGGGNTSIKTLERDHRGREVQVLRVKGSGSDLKSVQRKDFPGVRMDDILALLERDDMGDTEMVSYLAHGLRRHPDATALVLERHGTITWGATVRDAYDATLELVTRAEEAIAARKRGRRVFGGPRVPMREGAARRAAALAAAPRLRGALSRTRRVIVTFDDSPPILEFVSSAHGPRLSQIGPATPDHTIYTKRLPCVVALEGRETGESLVAAIEEAVERFVADD